MASEEGVYPATPASAQKLIAELFKEQPILKAADLCCGTGLPGLNILDAISGKWEEIEVLRRGQRRYFLQYCQDPIVGDGYPERKNRMQKPFGPAGRPRGRL